jgi:hypothetical protein
MFAGKKGNEFTGENLSAASAAAPLLSHDNRSDR